MPLSPLAGKMSPQVTEGGDAAGIEFAEKYPPLSDKSDISPTRGERGGCRTPNSSSSGLPRGSRAGAESSAIMDMIAAGSPGLASPARG